MPKRKETTPKTARPLLRTTLLSDPGAGTPTLKRALKTWINRAGTLMQAKGSAVFRIVQDDQMAQLHQDYTGVPGTTDVLTFDMRDDTDDPTLDVEIVLCIDEASRQAKQRGIPLEHELLLYAIHGLLHVTGFDDKTPAKARKMHKEEDRLLALLGIGPVYATPPAPTGAKPKRKRP